MDMTLTRGECCPTRKKTRASSLLRRPAQRPLTTKTTRSNGPQSRHGTTHRYRRRSGNRWPALA